MDKTDLSIICDEILRELNTISNDDYPYLTTAVFSYKHGFGIANRALLQLAKDDYVTKSNKDYCEPPQIEPNFLYTITVTGQTFIKNGGYERKNAKDMVLSDLESEKKWYDTENARRQFENYRFTKNIAIIATVISVGLLLLRLIESVNK